MKKYLALVLSLSVMLTAGCANRQETQNSLPTDPTAVQLDETMFTERDRKEEYDPQTAIQIELKGDTAISTANSVRIDGNTVTITEDGTYLLTGALAQGSIIVDAGDRAKPQLVLQGVDVTSEAAALEIRGADKVFVTLAEGTENTLSGGTGDAVDGTVFSKQDLTFNGSGSLAVISNEGHGIVCKDDLVFTGGSYQIQSASHGLDVNDSVRITDHTSLTMHTGKDGIHCENGEDPEKGFVYMEKGSLNITAEGDGLSAGAYVRILDGSVVVLAGGGHENGTKEHSDFFGGFMGGGRPQRPREVQAGTSEDSNSMKGLKAAGEITVAGGSFVMDTADDCIHSNGNIAISGGSFDLRSGDDAIHADESLNLKADINIKTSYEDLEAHKVYVHGGEMEIHAKDDGINASGGQDFSGTEGGRDGMFGGWGGGRPGGPLGSGSSDGVIDISGGQLKIYSSGDGMDANGSITISNGDIYVTNPSSGDTSVLDSDNGATITGGTFTSAGASTMMAQSFAAASTQGVIACTVGNRAAGTPVCVQDANGKTLVSYDTEYACVLVIISTPELKKGESYTLTVGDYSGPVQAS